MRDLVLRVEDTPAERGYRVAMRAGCFNCHGPDGTGGVKNPGSEDGEVPGFSGGTPMMWAKSEDELREYILDGAPARKRDDPRYKQQMEAQLLAMPAYRGYLGAARGRRPHRLHARRVRPGRSRRRAGGAGPGSRRIVSAASTVTARWAPAAVRTPARLKGYIPGWWGNDFRDLVRNDDELRGWIRDGQIPRLRDHPIAKHFIAWQRVSMPAYKDFITDQQLQALMRYVRWVNDGEWQQKPLDLGH